jgi:hypothetical protein
MVPIRGGGELLLSILIGVPSAEMSSKESQTEYEKSPYQKPHYRPSLTQKNRQH